MSQPLSLALTVAGWFSFAYVWISFFEHLIHRNLMHRKLLPDWLYSRSQYLLKTFEEHAIEHHSIWYKEFDYEPSARGREINLEIKQHETWTMLLWLLPFLAMVFWISPIGAAIFVAISLIHNRLWNILHREMHIPSGRFFATWWVFRWLARNHYMHHRRRDKNFNVVFPLFDWILGTRARPSLGDIRHMMRLNLLRPRTQRGHQGVHRDRREVELRRAGAGRVFAFSNQVLTSSDSSLSAPTAQQGRGQGED